MTRYVGRTRADEVARLTARSACSRVLSPRYEMPRRTRSTNPLGGSAAMRSRTLRDGEPGGGVELVERAGEAVAALGERRERRGRRVCHRRENARSLGGEAAP